MKTKIGNANGVIFVYTKDYIIKTHGENTWLDLLNNLSAEDKLHLSKNLIKTAWYSAPLLNRLINTYDAIHGNGDFAKIIPIVEHIAKNDLNPVFQVFLDLKNPAFVLNNAPTLWKRYFDSGEMIIDIADEENKRYILHLEEIADENLASGMAICTIGISTWIKTGLEMTEANNIRAVHTECRYKDDKSCTIEVTWD